MEGLAAGPNILPSDSDLKRSDAHALSVTNAFLFTQRLMQLWRDSQSMNGAER